MRELHKVEQRKFNKVAVSEIIDKGEVVDLEDDVGSNDPLCNAIRSEIRCWNCDKPGHIYIDCMEPRHVFCYGCGMRNTYRPTCVNCSKHKQGNGQKDVRRK